MPIPALALTCLALVAPAAPAPAVSQIQIWEVSVGLSGGVIYRMDTMPGSLHKPGEEMLRYSLQLAKRLSLPLPDDPVLRGAESDTLAAYGYVMGAANHPTAKFLAQQKGRPAAALFELGLLSHLAMTSVVPASDNGKELADQFEAAGRDTGLARDTWGGLVDALRSGKTRDAAKDALPDMLEAVGRACSR